MKRTLAFLLTLALLLSVCPAIPLQATATTYTEGHYTYTVSNGEATITGCDTSISGDIAIPATLGGYPVTSIGDIAFSRCYELTNVTIPDSVITTGQYVFMDCIGLSSVSISDNLSLIEEGMFLGCGLTNVTIPDSVRIISRSAFDGCTNLTSVMIPYSVTDIWEWAFGNCTSLTDIYYSGSKAQWDEISINPEGNTALANATIHTVEPPVDIVTQPMDAELTAGAAAEFTVEAAYAASYQWQYRRNEDAPWVSTTLTGYDTDILLVPAILSRNGYQYRCRVTGTDGRIIYSEPATLTVLDSIVITTQPTRQIATSDENATFTVEAEGAGLTYQWMYRKSDQDFWKQTGMAGNKTNTLTVPALLSRNGYQYMCAITDENGVKINSKAAVLSTIGFTVDPADQTAAVNTSAVFTATAEGQNLTYQWQYRKTEDGAWMNTTLTGCKTDTLTVLAIASRNGYQYRCRITDALGIIRYSDDATLTVE